ncbi:glycosyltransferase family 4 protein [bacterium]|nr:glycosyltransferase family 4 protein [bacterium]
MKPLAFVLSHDVTVSRLLSVSQFDRELDSLRNQLAVFGEVNLVSRDRSDPAVALPLAGVRYARSRWLYRAPRLYAWLVPIVFGRALRDSCGAYYHHYVAAFGAPLARRLYGARYMVACNWMKSEVIAAEGFPVRAALHRRLEAAVLGGAELVTVGSLHLEPAVRARAGARVEIMPRVHYIDPARFPAKEDYRAGDVFRLVAVGRLAPVKDYPLLISAVAACTGVELSIIAGGHDEAALRRLAEELRAPVVFSGYVENARLAERLRGFDAYVMTSRYEGTPKSLLEAMAVGLPCVARETAAFRDLLAPDRGLLVPGEVEPLREAVLRLARDPELRRRLGGRARDYVYTHHSREVSDRQERAALQRFREILQGREAAHASP